MAGRGWTSLAWPGLCAVLVGVGLGRFAYTPMIPALVSAGWLSPPEAAYVGAANLVGYLAGALAAGLAAQTIGAGRAIRAALFLTMASFAASAAPVGFEWLLAWRFLAGATGAVLMVLAPSRILIQVAPGERGRAGGLVITGVGLGVVLSGVLVGPLAERGPAFAWTALALLALIATAASWPRWRDEPPAAPPGAAPARPAPVGLALLLLFAAYATDGAGFVPHTLFWVDFIARELQLGTGLGAFNWLLFGVGAAAGPLVAGTLADRLGIGRTVALGFAAKGAAVLAPALLPVPVALAVSSVIVGALTPGITSLVAARLSEIVPPGRQARAWGRATLVFSVAQAFAAWAMSFAFVQLGAYRPLYLAGGLLELLGAVLALLHLAVARSFTGRTRSSG
jgi:MFS family permease